MFSKSLSLNNDQNAFSQRNNVRRKGKNAFLEFKCRTDIHGEPPPLVSIGQLNVRSKPKSDHSRKLTNGSFVRKL